jgi:NDP-sugar pyrophosphorylase family protein
MASAQTVTVAILCGGLGTRLGELTQHVPKAMVEVAGRPFLAHVIDSFRDCGFRDFVLLTGYRGEMIERHFGDGSRWATRIRYSREEEPIGTGGAVRNARDLLTDRFLLTYGDVLRRFDYDRFVAEHRDACLAVYARMTTGNTAIANGRVTEFEKSKDLPYVDAGFCVMPHDVIDLLPAKGSFEQTVFPRLADDRRLECEIVDHDFVEIGTPEALAHARAVLS